MSHWWGCTSHRHAAHSSHDGMSDAGIKWIFSELPALFTKLRWTTLCKNMFLTGQLIIPKTCAHSENIYVGIKDFNSCCFQKKKKNNQTTTQYEKFTWKSTSDSKAALIQIFNKPKNRFFFQQENASLNTQTWVFSVHLPLQSAEKFLSIWASDWTWFPSALLGINSTTNAWLTHQLHIIFKKNTCIFPNSYI